MPYHCFNCGVYGLALIQYQLLWCPLVAAFEQLFLCYKLWYNGNRGYSPSWHILCLFVQRRFSERCILICFQYLCDIFGAFHVTVVHCTFGSCRCFVREVCILYKRRRYIYLLLTMSALCRCWTAYASLGHFTHKRWRCTEFCLWDLRSRSRSFAHPSSVCPHIPFFPRDLLTAFAHPAPPAAGLVR